MNKKDGELRVKKKGKRKPNGGLKQTGVAVAVDALFTLCLMRDEVVNLGNKA